MNVRLVLCLIAFSTSYACVQPPPRGATTPVRLERAAPVTPPKSETERLLDEFTVLKSLPKEQVAKDFAEAGRAVSQAPSMINRIRLAWLLGLPGTPFQDLNRSLTLLQEVLKDEAPDEAGVKRLAGFVYSQYNRDLRNQETIQALNLRLADAQKRVDDSQKQDETVSTLTQKLKEEQKRNEVLVAKQEESTQTIGSLAQKLKEEKQKAEQLQQKLDALADIEKSMVDRQQQPKAEPKR